MPVNKTKKAPAKRAPTNRGASVGGIKTHSAKKLTFFSVLASIVLVALGYGGYYAWQQRNHKSLNNGLKAHAANYGSVIGAKSGYYIAVACWKQYSSSKPDEVWVLVGRESRNVGGTIWAANIGGRTASTYPVWLSNSWWNGNLQSFHIPVGRANILNGAYISGSWSQNVGAKGGGSSAVIWWGSNSLTAQYGGTRIANPSHPDKSYPLIKGLPVCGY